MGTEITLEVGGINLTYSKNHIGIDHGCLFQENDRKRYKSDQINYEYFEEINEEPVTMEMAFVRTLKSLVPRLELLGYSLETAQNNYDAVVLEYKEYKTGFEEEVFASDLEILTFEEFICFIKDHPVSQLSAEFVSGFNDESAKAIRGRFDGMEIVKKIPFYDENNDGYSEVSYFGNLINILHPYAVLRILAQNPLNHDLEVVWQYGPLVENGWTNVEEFISGVRRNQTFLIATEGSSDVHILKHAFSILRPEISDFFKFIDVEQSHPFSGTGNLLKFADGLIKIDILNKVLFLFDNDAEGRDAHYKLCNKTLPYNIRSSILPDIDTFNNFNAYGPDGLTRANINGRAASIECYLDLNHKCTETPSVRWTNYKKDLDCYQGALDNKDQYTKIFLKLNAEDLAIGGGYNTQKLELLLGSIVAECCAISSVLNVEKS